jgi:DNA-binding CsgD family transcriptional regulator
MEEVFYNKEALRILSFSDPKRRNDIPDLISFCSRWSELIEGNPEGVFIDILQSRRRRYGVRGGILSGYPHTSEKQYFFVLERVSPEGANLPFIYRQWRLSPREKEIVRLLLLDHSNKEIAHTLGLKLNTIKSYMKLLMRKCGVNSRAGIIATLLTGKNPSF